MLKSASLVTRDAQPSIVRRLEPLVQGLLRLGVPMGPNVLMTVRGRTTGEPRTIPVALLRTGDRSYLFSPFGEVNWVRNLRAAGVASLRHGRWVRDVEAVELDPDAAAPILEAGLRPVMRMPGLGTMIASWYGIDRRSTPEDYLAAAHRHPGFELRELEHDEALPPTT
jgi:deazaflavin-dependent oxidoreductase (nitroreductase family)